MAGSTYLNLEELMEFERIEDLKMVRESALKQWKESSLALKIQDPLIPVWPNAAKWSLEEDFGLFAEFWSPEDCDPDNGLEVSRKLIKEWILDRVTRQADRRPEERRASIIMGDHFFFGPDKIEILLDRKFPAADLKGFEKIPSEAELREKRESHILYYGCRMTDCEITTLISEHLMDPDVKDYAEGRMKRPETVIHPGWHFAPILGMEDAGNVDLSWPTAFAYVLFQLSRKSAFAA